MTTTAEAEPVEGVEPETDSWLDIDPDSMMFPNIDTSAKPQFTISETAEFFFAKSKHWIRWVESQGRMGLVVKPEKKCKDCKSARRIQGPLKAFIPCPTCTVPVGDRRDPKSNIRIYLLEDIEQVAHALATNGAISGTQLRHTLRLLRVQGEMHDYL